MNRYLEAIAVGALAAAATFIVGIGLGGSSNAATPPGARNRIELRPQISGRVTTIDFVSEQEVTKGEVLVTIDKTPYEAAVDKAQAELGRAQWRYLFAVRKHAQAALRCASRRSSPEDLAASSTAVEQAGAAIQADKSSLEVAQRNLASTKVIAPFSGIVGRPEVGLGSLVESGQTRLTTLVPSDRIKVVRY